MATFLSTRTIRTLAFATAAIACSLMTAQAGPLAIRGEKLPLAFSEAPFSVTPDGTRLVYMKQETSGFVNLYSSGLDGSDESRITDSKWKSAFRWMPFFRNRHPSVKIEGGDALLVLDKLGNDESMELSLIAVSGGAKRTLVKFASDETIMVDYCISGSGAKAFVAVCSFNKLLIQEEWTLNCIDIESGESRKVAGIFNKPIKVSVASNRDGSIVSVLSDTKTSQSLEVFETETGKFVNSWHFTGYMQKPGMTPPMVWATDELLMVNFFSDSKDATMFAFSPSKKDAIPLERVGFTMVGVMADGSCVVNEAEGWGLLDPKTGEYSRKNQLNESVIAVFAEKIAVIHHGKVKDELGGEFDIDNIVVLKGIE